jgi:hypothetical protein
VHPLQLIEATVLIERAEWQVASNGHKAAFSAHRSLSDWIIVCPHCGRPPATLVVCRHDHGACDACVSRCSVCAEDFCADHGVSQCRVDEQPVCEEHARVCQSCRMAHCSTHEGSCAEGDHAACTACLAACGSCGRVVCNRHAEQARADAPKGSRRLCTACVRQCEGGNETVGLDEVTQCATCEKPVCSTHQAVCAIDGQVHCSKHLRHTDASRRPVCAEHRAACAYDEAEVFAADEVEECPICGKGACAGHRAACGYCGRHVCTRDLRSVDMQPRRCVTCEQLARVSTPPDAVLSAALKITNGHPKSSRRWRMARDRSHLVLELDQGLTRKTVFTLRHGSDAPDSVVKHSLMGSKQRK